MGIFLPKRRRVNSVFVSDELPVAEQTLLGLPGELVEER
jgi:hypothetical protein